MKGLEIRVNQEAQTGVRELWLKPGFYDYEARLGERAVSGSIEVEESGQAALLYLYLPQKAGRLIGAGGQPKCSPSGDLIAYIHGNSINIYDLGTKRTGSVGVAGDSNYYIVGWIDQQSLVLSAAGKPGAWLVTRRGHDPWRLEKADERTLLWSGNCKYAACGASDFSSKTGAAPCSLPLDHIYTYDPRYLGLAIDATGSFIACAGSGSGVGSGDPERWRCSIILYDLGKEETFIVEDDIITAPDLISFSPGGTYLCYPKVKDGLESALVVYDPSRRVKAAELENAGIWWDWNEDESALLWVRRPGEIVSRDMANQKETTVYRAENERGVTGAAWLQGDRIGFMEESALYILKPLDGDCRYIDDDVAYFTALPLDHRLLYIADNSYIVLTDY